MNLETLFALLWSDYAELCPQAEKVHQLLIGRGDVIQNDHVAFRMWGTPGFDIDALAGTFIDRGYVQGGEYRFDTKKLVARHYTPPRPGLPRVFVSQLDLPRFEPDFRARVERIVSHAPQKALGDDSFCVSGRLWPVSYSEYQALLSVSEYAAWLAVFGIRANHFTVSVNALKSVGSLQSLCDVLLSHGFQLNDDGGLIKGSPEQWLEQASTLAGTVNVTLDDGVFALPGCYYEFARRYRMSSGQLFDGFVTASADHLFTSTDRR